MAVGGQLLKGVLVVLIAVVFLFLYLRYIERRSLYIPFREIDETPASAGLSFQDLYLNAVDGVSLNAWFIPAKDTPRMPEEGRLTLFYLHGNGGNLSHRIGKVAFFHELGMNVFIIDYRGYGKSTGVPSEEGLYVDARCGYEYLINTLKVPAEDIVVFGESLGAAVAIQLASEVKLRALILEGAFTSVAEMSRRVYPLLPTVYLRTRYDSVSKINNITAPKFFIHSRNDEVVPYDMGLRLFKESQEPKTFFEIHGGHNEAFFSWQNQIREKIIRFLDTI